MNKKNFAIILEMVPLVSAVVSFVLIESQYESKPVMYIITVTVLLSFIGFLFFFIGRKLCKENKTVLILGILDWLATIYVILLYVAAIFAFGL